MFSELVDVLRCPRPHEESWLVLAAHRLDGRDIVAGVLGCPVCHQEFPIRDGVVRFADASPNASASPAPSEEEAIRLAALLDLAGGRGYAVILGALGAHAAHVQELTDLPLLLVNPPADTAKRARISGLTIGGDWLKLPLAPSSARAIAFEDGTTPAQLSAGIEILAAGGRVLAPVALTMPDGLKELARDDRQWLAEREQVSRSSGVVRLQRRK